MSGRSVKTKTNDKDKEQIRVNIHFLGAKIQFGTSRYTDAIVTPSFMKNLTPMNDIVIHGNKYVQTSSRSRYGPSNSASSSIGRSSPNDLKERETEPLQEEVVKEVVAPQPEKKRRGRKRKVVVQEVIETNKTVPESSKKEEQSELSDKEIKEKNEIQPSEEKIETETETIDQYEGIEHEEDRVKKKRQLAGSYFADSTNSLYSAETVDTFPVRVASRVDSRADSSQGAVVLEAMEEEEDDEVMKQVMSLIEDLQAEEAASEAALRHPSASLPPLPRATVRVRTPLSADFERRIHAQIESIAMTSSTGGIAFRESEETVDESCGGEEVQGVQESRESVGFLALPKINMTSRFVRYIPNKNMGNQYLDHRLLAQLDVWSMLPESSLDFWLWIDKLRLFQPIAPHTHDPTILELRDIGLEKHRRRFFTPFELLSLEETGSTYEPSADHSLAPESLFALTVQCRDWLERCASSEEDNGADKEEEAEKAEVADHRSLDVIIAQMEDEIVTSHLQVNRIIARVRRAYFEHPLFWHEASIVTAVQQERKILLGQYRALQRRRKVVSPSRL